MFFEQIYREIYASISQFDVKLNKLTDAKNKNKDFRQILAKLLAKIRLYCFCFQGTPKHNTKYIDCNGVGIYNSFNKFEQNRLLMVTKETDTFSNTSPVNSINCFGQAFSLQS